MSILQYPSNVLDDKFFKEKAYHEGITIIATVGCEESHVRKTANCLSHIQNLFEKRRIDVRLSDIFKYVLLIGSKEAGEDFSDKMSTTYNWDAIFIPPKNLIAINNMFSDNLYNRSLSKLSIEGFDQNYSNMLYILTHEIGHAVQDCFITKEARDYYDGISNLFINLAKISDVTESNRILLYDNALKTVIITIYEEIKKEVLKKDYYQGHALNYEDLCDLLSNQEINSVNEILTEILNSESINDFRDYIEKYHGSSEEHSFVNLANKLFLNKHAYNIVDIVLGDVDESNITRLEEILAYAGEYHKVKKELEVNRKKKLYSYITELVNSAKGEFKNFFIDSLESLTELNFGDMYKAVEDIVEELFVSSYSTENVKEDFAEHFAHFIVNREKMSDWNANRIINTLDMSRAFGKELMKAHKDFKILKKYLKVVVENILKA